jgi:hypothetical protein
MCQCADVPMCQCAGVPVCRCAGVPVCRCADVPVCRCADVPVCRCAGVPCAGVLMCQINGWLTTNCKSVELSKLVILYFNWQIGTLAHWHIVLLAFKHR